MTAPVRPLAPGLLALLCTVQLVMQLDASIVNVALATVQGELGFADAELQWVVTGYALTYGSLLLVGGRAGDLVGRRRLLQAGLVVFAVASLACGLATSPLMLVIARLVQGVGGALVSPSALSILTGVTPQSRARTRALSYWQAAAAVGAAAGVVLGGLLTEFLSWRAVFLVNVPIVAVALVLVPRIVPADHHRADARLDLLGAITVAAGLGAFGYALSAGHQYGFTSPQALVAGAGAVVLLAGFVLRQVRGRNPMVPRQVLAAPTRAASNVVMLLLWVVIASYIFFAGLYMQRVLGFPAGVTGIAFLPSPILITIGSAVLARRLITRIGYRRVLLLGLGFLGVGQLLFALVGEHGTYAGSVLPGLLCTGLGMGLSLPSVSVGATAGVAPADQGLAGGLFNTSQQLGAAIGLSVLAAVAAQWTSTSGSLAAGYALGFAITTGVTVAALVVTVWKVRPMAG